MGRISLLAGGVGQGGSGSALTFGTGFNVNGTTVQFALDDPSNMLFDPGFEDSPPLAQWTQFSGTWARSSADVFQGTYSLAYVGGVFGSIGQTFHSDPGDQFLLQIYSATTSGATGSADLVMVFLDSSGSQIGASLVFSSIGPGTSWNVYDVNGVAPTTASQIRIYVQMNSGATGTWYFDNASLRRITVGNNIAVGVIQTSHLAPGSLGDFSKYSNSVRAIGITNGLPTLPNASFPSGAIIFNTFDGKLYRNVSGVWSKGVDPQDLIAGTLAVGVEYAGTINAAQVNAGLFNGLGLILNLNGVTTTINNAVDGSTGRSSGIIVSLNSSPNTRITADYDGFNVIGSSNTVLSQLTASNLLLQSLSGGIITAGAGTRGVIQLSGSGSAVYVGAGAGTQLTDTTLSVNGVLIVNSSGQVKSTVNTSGSVTASSIASTGQGSINGQLLVYLNGSYQIGLGAAGIAIGSGMVYYCNGIQVVSTRRTGWGTPTGTLLRSALATGSATALQVAETLGALITDLLAHGLIGP